MYNGITMALEAKITKKDKGDGTSEEVFSLEFTNGTLKQLKDLSDFLKKDGFKFPDEEAEKLKEVLRISIGWLESVKERRDKEDSEKL